MDRMWKEAGKSFHDICEESLEESKIRSFDVLRKEIEKSSQKNPFTPDPEERGLKERSKDFCLISLNILQGLTQTASAAASLVGCLVRASHGSADANTCGSFHSLKQHLAFCAARFSSCLQYVRPSANTTTRLTVSSTMFPMCSNSYRYTE